ncbi:MAG: bifunctional prephenate dehydrogenase/3-phosphoshikimate 1-carboxyvinyltransferase [Pseudohongiellaceae bacterium]
MNKPLPKTVLIIGLGLIGGSIARSIKAAKLPLRVLAADSSQAALDAAMQDGVVDEAGKMGEANKTDEMDAVRKLAAKAELIIVALPPQASAELLPMLATLTSLSQATVITDVCSVKVPITQAANKCGADFLRRFVPGHPIAGSEQSGYHAAQDELFVNRNAILTPLIDNDPDAISLVHQFWRALGGTVLGMSPARHDEVLAATSHLPHLLAYSIMDVLLKHVQGADVFRCAAGGLADFSRLAASDPALWSDIFGSNAEPLAAALDTYIADLLEFRQALQQGDRTYMMNKLSRSKQLKTGSREELVYLLQPGGNVTGKLRVPGDKSISHRAVILAAIADGVTRINGFLEGEDSLCTVAALREMGVTIVGPEQGRLTIYGVGKEGLQPPRKPLDMGNSGTAMRLLAGLLAAQPFASKLVGDDSLSQRPMHRIAEPLGLMGATLGTTEQGTPPLHIRGGPLHGISWQMPVASAQVKSCLLLAGLYADGTTEITEPEICRDHTERMLTKFNYPLTRNATQRICQITNEHRLQGTTIDIPADISSAAFFMVAAAITPGAELTLNYVGVNPTRTGIINLLRLMGADIQLNNLRGGIEAEDQTKDQTKDKAEDQTEDKAKGEPTADIIVRHQPLTGIEIPTEQVSLAIDEFPALCIAAACADGETVLSGAEELQVKESNRIEAMAAGLRTLGVTLETRPDGIRIQGSGANGTLGGGEVNSHGDHRIAMAFAIAALRASAPIRIRHCNNVNTSFPDFHNTAAAVGLKIQCSNK